MNMSEGPSVRKLGGRKGSRAQTSFEKETQKLASEKESNGKRGARGLDNTICFVIWWVLYTEEGRAALWVSIYGYVLSLNINLYTNSILFKVLLISNNMNVFAHWYKEKHTVKTPNSPYNLFNKKKFHSVWLQHTSLLNCSGGVRSLRAAIHT